MRSRSLTWDAMSFPPNGCTNPVEFAPHDVVSHDPAITGGVRIRSDTEPPDTRSGRLFPVGKWLPSRPGPARSQSRRSGSGVDSHGSRRSYRKGSRGTVGLPWRGL